MRISFLLAALLCVSCTTTPVPSDKKWAVQVKDAQLVGNSAFVPGRTQATDSASIKSAAPTLPTTASLPSGKTLWVWHADGSKQCGKAKGIDPERLAKAVKARGIAVSQYRSSVDGARHPMICGLPTGKIIELEISAKDLPKAKKLGLLEKTPEN
jgi:hypothetical protein